MNLKRIVMNPGKVIVLLSFLLILCQGLTAQDKKEARFNFPADFGREETTVLIAGGSTDKITKSMIEAFEKYYKGKFELIRDKTMNEIIDVKKYRYIFNVTEHISPAYSAGKDRFPASPIYKFGLKDQKTGKEYPTDFWSGSHKKGANYYAENLEKFRKKNAGP
jgi:hypothetical protein